MIPELKSAVRIGLYRSDLLGAWHRRRNRGALTIAMFHRVLPPDDPRYAGSDPLYTVTVDEFRACLELFKAHYAIVPLAAVTAGLGGSLLPPCPLLVTFDDGWRDNFEFAFPVLRELEIPAVIFVASSFIGDELGFWQERVFDVITTHRADPNALATILGGDSAISGPPVAIARAAIGRIAAMSPALRADTVVRLCRAQRPLPRAMMTAEDLTALRGGGIALGGHGDSHEPLPAIPNPAQDLSVCFSKLKAYGDKGDSLSMSFPHGRYSPEIVEAARGAGFGPLFSSEPVLTDLRADNTRRVIGRIEIDLEPVRQVGGIGSAAGSAFLAHSLMSRPIGRLVSRTPPR